MGGLVYCIEGFCWCYLLTWAGRCYPEDTLREILRFCSRHQLHVISDEVYASCVFDSGDPAAVPFTSILSIDVKALIDPNLVHVLWGFSKVRNIINHLPAHCLAQHSPTHVWHRGVEISRLTRDTGFRSRRPPSRFHDHSKRATPRSMQSHRVSCTLPIPHSTRLASISNRPCTANRRLHHPSTTTQAIGATILEDRSFVANFTDQSARDLANTYRIATSALDREGINYVKGGYVPAV